MSKALEGTVEGALEQAVAALDRQASAYGTTSTVGALTDHPAATALPEPHPERSGRGTAPRVAGDGQCVATRPVPAPGQHEAALRAEFTRQTEENPS